MDGVLVDTKLIHFEALNNALQKIENFNISFEDHSDKYDGLPTSKKLEILLKKKKIKKKNNNLIKKLKKNETDRLLKKKIIYSKKIHDLFSKLSGKYKLGVATNAVKNTLKICINNLKIARFISFSISNENLKFPKPHPEIYLRCLIEMGIKPNETLVLEDLIMVELLLKRLGVHSFRLKN